MTGQEKENSMREKRAGILAAGNWIVDHVKVIDQYPKEESLAIIQSETTGNGGGPYNLLKNLSRMGAAFPLEGIGLLGDDAEGHGILEDCQRSGISTSQLHVTKSAHTSYTDVMTVASTGKRTFFHQRGANSLLDASHFNLADSNARIFYLGYVLLLDKLDVPVADGLTDSARLLKQAVELGFQTAVDVVSENSQRFKTVVWPVLPFVDFLIINEFEAARISGVATQKNGHIDRTGLLKAAREMLSLGVRQWVVIHFPEGALAVSPSGKSHFVGSVQVPREKIAGTAGAGDAFAAGFLYGMHEGWSVQASLRLGASVAATSLLDSTCSGSVRPVDECLKMGEMFGFRDAGM